MRGIRRLCSFFAKSPGGHRQLQKLQAICSSFIFTQKSLELSPGLEETKTSTTDISNATKESGLIVREGRMALKFSFPP